MANYTTNSGFNVLDGSMVVSGNDVTSYTSNSNGVCGVRNNGGNGLNFNVTVPGVQRTYHIIASASGTGYSGTANDGSAIATQDTWTATATTGKPRPKSKRAKASGK
jgi:hypothetical protein